MTERGLFEVAEIEERGRTCRRVDDARSARVPRLGRSTPRLERSHGRLVLTLSRPLLPSESAQMRLRAESEPVAIRFRVPTVDRRLCDVLDPGGASPGLRFAGVRRARRAGFEAGVLVAPLIPGVDDLERDLVDLAMHARAAGACFLEVEIAQPDERSRSALLRSLQKRYPRAAARYQVRLLTSHDSDREARAALEARVAAIGRRFGLPPPSDHPPEASGQRRFSFAG